MSIRRTSNRSSQDTGFYNPEFFADVGSRIVYATSPDPDAAAYVLAVQAADNEALEGGVVNAITDFVVGCKSDGIWDAIKASCILAGARTLNGALVPLVGTAPTNYNFWGDADPNWADVSLLLRMNGADGGTTFTDSSSNTLTVTPVGNAQTSTAQSKFGGSSALFDGSGDYLSLSSNSVFSFDSDFTVELWVRQASSPTETFPILLERGNGTQDAGSWGIIINNSGANKTCSFFYGGPRAYVSVGALTFDTWHHIAVSRSRSTLRTFLDGAQTSAATVTDNLTITAPLRVGSSGYGIPSNYFKGNVDDLRITKGVARYTSSFTPSTLTAPGSSSDYNRITGLVGDGSTKYLDSNRNNNVDPQNSQHMAVFPTTVNTTDTDRVYIGTGINSTGSTYFATRSVDAFARNRSASADTGLVRGSASTLIGVSRSTSSNYTYRRSGVSQLLTRTSETPLAGNVFVYQGNGFSAFSNASLAFYSIGESLDLALLDNRVTRLVNEIAFFLNTGLDGGGYNINTLKYVNAGYAAGGSLS